MLWKQTTGAQIFKIDRACQKKKIFDPLQILRTTFGPLIFVIFILWALISFILNRNVRDAMAQTRTFPPFAVLVTSIFLTFPPALSYAIFTSVVCVATLYWPLTKWNGWLALGQSSLPLCKRVFSRKGFSILPWTSRRVSTCCKINAGNSTQVILITMAATRL